MLLDLAHAKTQLDIVTDAYDEALTLYIEGLTDPVERLIGAVLPRTVTERTRAAGDVLCLGTIPVRSVTVLAPAHGGTGIEVASLDVEQATGIVRSLDGRSLAGTWQVTYEAGRGPQVPPTIRLAALMLLQHLWRTRNGGGRGARADDFDTSEPIPGFGYAIPNRVLQLLEPYRLPPAVA
ncbi:hypothetical protein [Streptomyces albidoflavus]|uniref:hypothetical protein n=1 Tax=Streptomyces albidoflavus TaxID=1886 RepID=UPI00340A5D13